MGYIADGTETARLTKLLKNAVGHDFSVTMDTNPLTIKFTLRERNQDIAGFTLTEMINCCGIFVSTKTFVNPTHQGRKMAQEMMPLKEILAKEYGYSMLLATVNVSGNPAEVHILEKFGWIRGTAFNNQRTKNNVAVFTKILNPEIKKKDK